MATRARAGASIHHDNGGPPASAPDATAATPTPARSAATILAIAGRISLSRSRCPKSACATRRIGRPQSVTQVRLAMLIHLDCGQPGKSARRRLNRCSRSPSPAGASTWEPRRRQRTAPSKLLSCSGPPPASPPSRSAKLPATRPAATANPPNQDARSVSAWHVLYLEVTPHRRHSAAIRYNSAGRKARRS